MALALLPFFQFFRGTPHQLAAVKQLEESLPPELLEEHEADWFQAWKESGYAGKNSNDPEWIMQDPRGYPEMEKGGHSNPHLGRNVRVRQAAFYQRWQSEGPGTGWVILVNE